MAQALQDMKVAILVTDGFEQVELTEPRKVLEQAGAQVRVVSPANGKVKGWNHTDWGNEIPVDEPLDQARAEQYDALVLPGGVMNPDKLRRNERALTFVKGFFDDRKPVAVICHGPWTLIDAGVVRGRRITSYPTLQTDLKNAGAEWMDEEVVVDRGLISSRRPDDIPAFNKTMVEEFFKSRHQKRYRSMKNTVNGIHACRTTSPCRGENSLPTERFFRIDRQDWNVNQKLFQDDAGGAKDPGTQLSPAGQSTAQPRLDFLRHDYAGDEKHHADCQKNVEQHLGDVRRSFRDTGESERGCDKGNHKKYGCPF